MAADEEGDAEIESKNVHDKRKAALPSVAQRRQLQSRCLTLTAKRSRSRHFGHVPAPRPARYVGGFHQCFVVTSSARLRLS